MGSVPTFGTDDPKYLAVEDDHIVSYVVTKGNVVAAVQA